jgi:hypothetical protein
MLSTIQLNYQNSAMAEEINNIVTYHHLPVNAYRKSAEIFVPELIFLPGGFLSKLSGTVSEWMW